MSAGCRGCRLSKSGTCGGLENIRVFRCTRCSPKSQVLPVVMRDTFKELHFSKRKKQKCKEPQTKGSHNRINLRLNTVFQEDIHQSLDVSCPWKGLGLWKKVFGRRKLLEGLTSDAIRRVVSEQFEKWTSLRKKRPIKIVRITVTDS